MRRPGPAGPETRFSGKMCAYAAYARSTEKFAYGVCGGKFGPAPSSAARSSTTGRICQVFFVKKNP